VDTGTKSLLFNAVPLLVLAALYLVVGLALVPGLWRDRRRLSILDVALCALFPCIAVPAAVFGILVLHDERPLGGELWSSFVATLVAYVPPLLLVARWRERALVATAQRAREAEARTTIRDRELEAVSAISTALARTQDAEAAARLLLRHVLELLGVEFAALALVDEDLTEAVGFLALSPDGELEWWRDVRLDLENEPSGIASAVFDAAPVSIYDVEGSTRVSPRLAEAVGAKSGVWVPLISEERVLGVLVAATTGERRAFTSEEITLIQALAGDAALAFDRTQSAAALEQALERERLVSRVGTRVRSELDVDALLQVAVSEIGAALEVDRCFVRLGVPGEPMPVAAEWLAAGAQSIGGRSAALAVSNLALRERRTVAIEEVEAAPELDDLGLGGREALRELDARAVLATPIVAFDEIIGVLSVHRSRPKPWGEADVTVVEAVAREVSLALHTARLLEENTRRLEQQAGLLKAAQSLGSELQLDAVLQLLVDQVALLLAVDAADCYLLDPARGTLRCAAVHGLPAELVGFEFESGKGVTGQALRTGRPVLVKAYDELADPVPHAAYAGFAQAMVAPMRWSGETLGALGVGVRRDGREFAQSDADFLEAFAGLASLALRNAESFADRTRQARIQLGFYRIAAILGQSLSLNETYNAVAQAASEALGGAFAAVLLPHAKRLELVGAYDLPDAFRGGVATSTDALVDAAREGRVLAASALAEDDRFDQEWRALAARCGCGSLLAVPFERARGEGGGLVLVFFSEGRAFADEDLELARNLAGAARGALERAELFEAERSARALSQQLARTGGLLATELDPAAVLDEVVQQAPRLVGAEACTISVLEEDELVVTAAEGTAAEGALGMRSPTTGPLAGDVVQSRAPVAVESAVDEPRLARADPVVAAGCASYLGVPLVGPEGALHGVLSVYGERPRAWRPEEVEALRALAGNTSAALSNAELYQRVALEKERSFAILANIADGIVAVDRDGRVVLWNRAAEEITGVPQEEALGHPPAEVLGRELESNGETPSGDRLVPIVRSGQEAWLSVTEAVMRDPAGLVAGRIFAFRDISADRAVEQMKSDFVSAVSHELRTPLTSIYGFAETLLRQDVLFGEEERRTFLRYIASESERLTRIVDALLSVARLDTGDLQVVVAPTDVGAAVSEAVAAVQETAPGEHSFVVDVAGEGLAAAADPEKLRQILAVLLDNAVRYSPTGGTVTVSARRKADKVELEVADEGIGIPAAEQERIFRKFYRAEASARDGGAGGTGLGLFIAQGLVQAMGGRIAVASVEGEGSTFSFELPLARLRVASAVE
jgi:two-component system, OmpR family, phosphate regulon sensor histidine kinase PhoR